ncbi:DUF6626 family protein [Sphingobium agri]|uniref:Uncharacterized protein n=1 Tax=Sphingobium agri TaxID=2933566 RepID=A0ABT0DTK0_9SPHN|nr:hypothetical protein [Sphingobium agri]
MIVDDIYTFFRAVGATSSHAQFSVQHMGHSRRYYDYLRCSRAQPNVRAVLRLALTLLDMALDSDLTPDQNRRASGLGKRAFAYVIRRCRPNHPSKR